MDTIITREKQVPVKPSLYGIARKLGPARLLILGFLSYVLIGATLLSLPIAQKNHVGMLDNLFTATSGVSTTGLTTVSVSDSYTLLGQVVILLLFQLGGLGYMTFSSLIILARNIPMSGTRVQVLRMGFSLPDKLILRQFFKRIWIFAFIIEVLGVVFLYAAFRAAGVENALWSALFHAVSAFTTAGFSLYNDSMGAFAGNGYVNAIIAVLCYMGAVGFIVLQDAWLCLTNRKHRITVTSKIILLMTAAIFMAGTFLVFLEEPSIEEMPLMERFLAASFQVMTASSTAGFNTIPIPALSSASLALIIIVMVIGASPSGTGGGIKTTAVTVLYAILRGVLQGKTRIEFLGREIPMGRVLTAVAASIFYVSLLAAGIYQLAITENAAFLDIAFECASALGTVGLSMGITGSLTPLGKFIIILLMFIGRVGPLTIGFSLVRLRDADRYYYPEEDVAV